MLAYVFSHWPEPGMDVEQYERNLLAFHVKLADSPPHGFHMSRVLFVEGVTWLPVSGGAYEDWYLVEDSAALDPLNEAAVSGARQGPHDRVAHEAGGGTGALYRVHSGTPETDQPGWATWLWKPNGMSYAAWYERLRPWTERAGSVLWRRQMVLGPAREFCLHSPQQLDLPAELGALTLPLRTVHAGPPA